MFYNACECKVLNTFDKELLKTGEKGRDFLLLNELFYGNASKVQALSQSHSPWDSPGAPSVGRDEKSFPNHHHEW